MTILALEFSSERRSVALARDGQILSEAEDHSGGRGTKAFSLIEKVLADAGVARQTVEAVAVGLGPGSYTGIRAAIAIAQGWQLATGAKLLGVSSAEAMAAQAQAENIFGPVNVLIDAQRGEFYRAAWELSTDERREVAPLKIISGPELASIKVAGGLCIGPEQERAVFPAASTIARLAAGRTDFVEASGLVPIYLRETTFVKAAPARTGF